MILVTGATGTIGSEVVRQLAQKDVPVRALVRSFEKGKALEQPNVQIVTGDFEHPETLVRAMEGVERVFLVSPQHPRQVQHQGNVIEAAQQAGVKHIVKLSTPASYADSAVAVGRWHWQNEQHLAQSGLASTILRPHMLMQSLLPMLAPNVARFGVVTLPTQDTALSVVDVRDVAAVAVAALTEDGHAGREYLITGSELLTASNFAEQLAAVFGRPISTMPINVPMWEQALLGQGVPASQVKHLVEMAVFMLEGGNTPVTNVVATVTGKEPRTFAQLVREQQEQFRGPGTQPLSPREAKPQQALAAIERVGHVALYVSDLERSRRFYEDVLGMYHSETHLPQEHPTNALLRITLCFMSFGERHHDLVLVQEFDTQGHPVPVENHGVMHVAFALRPDQTTPAFAERLKARGVPIFYGPVKHKVGPDGDGAWGGNYAVYFHDPDGHLIEVYSGMDSY